MSANTDKMDKADENASKGFTKGVAFVVIVGVAIAIGLGAVFNDGSEPKLDTVLESLLKQEKELIARTKLREKPKVAIGYGACQDLFVSAIELLGPLGAAPETPEHFNEIENQDQLLKMFAYFFRHGAAAERFVSNDDLFDKLVEKAMALKDHNWATGGNTPVMALRFAQEGAEVLLAAKMTAGMKNKLPKEIQVAGADNTVQKDDIHLILEYKRDEEWEQYQSPRANRFIVHSDVNNPTVSSLEDFGTALQKYDPDLLLVSGLQMMDNFPFKEGERLSRLLKIQDQMKRQDFAKTRIHFEMASFVDESLLKELTDHVIPYADSLGMNEQELPNLHSMLKFGNVSLVSDSNPRIAAVLDEMREVFRLLSATKIQQTGPRKLTRLHIHTLAYQAIMIKKGSPWKNLRMAAVKASLTANRHVCASYAVDLKKAFILMDDSFSTSARVSNARRIPFNERYPVACWTEDEIDVEVCIAPNLVCSEAKQTAGGGDNISAAGLVPQI